MENYRHPRMDWRHEFVRVRRDYRKALEPFSIRRIFPSIPKARKGERCLSRHREFKFSLQLVSNLLPLKKAITWHETTPLFQRLSPHGLCRERFCPGIECRAELLRILRKERNHAPPHRHKLAILCIPV